MTCYISPFSDKISQDEFLLILNSLGLYYEYTTTLENDLNLTDFLNNHSKKIVDQIETNIGNFRSFKKGTLENQHTISTNPLISYFINNNINQDILLNLDSLFVKMYYRVASGSNSSVNLFLNTNELLQSDYMTASDNGNVLANFFRGLIAYYLPNLEDSLISGQKSVNGVKVDLTEYDIENIKQTINYIKSLGLHSIHSKNITTLYNFRNNTKLIELINFFGRGGLFKLDQTLLEKINEEASQLEGTVKIYEKDPLTEDPIDKISGRLKLLLRGIEKYTSKGVVLVKSGNKVYWKPEHLLAQIQATISKGGVHNLNINQMMEILQRETESNTYLSSPFSIFLDRLETLEKQTNSKIDIKTDLFLFLQKFPVGIVTVNQVNATKEKEKLKNQNSLVEDNYDNFFDNNEHFEEDGIEFDHNEYFEEDGIEFDHNEGDQSGVVFNNKKSNKSSKIKTKIREKGDVGIKVTDVTKFSEYNVTKLYDDIVNDLVNNSILKEFFYLNKQGRLMLGNFEVTAIPEVSEKFAKFLSTYVTLSEKDIQLRLRGAFQEYTGKPMLFVAASTMIHPEYILSTPHTSRVFNLNGDTIFPTVGPSELSRNISLINEAILMVRNNIPFDQTPFFEKFGSDIVGMSMWGDYASNSTSSLLKMSLFIGTEKVLTKEKMEYSALSERDLLLSLFHISNNEYISSPILADGSFNLLISGYNIGSTAESLDWSKLGEIRYVSHFDYIKKFLDIDSHLYDLIVNKKTYISRNLNKNIKKHKLLLFNPQSRGIVKDNKEVIDLYKTLKESNDGVVKEKASNDLQKIIAQHYEHMLSEQLDKMVALKILSFDSEKNEYKIIDDSLFEHSYNNLSSEQLIDNIRHTVIQFYVMSTNFDLIGMGHAGFYKPKDKAKRNKAAASSISVGNIDAVKNGEFVVPLNRRNARRIMLKDVLAVIDNPIMEQYYREVLESEGVSQDVIKSKLRRLFSNASLNDGTKLYIDNHEDFKVKTTEFLDSEKNKSTLVLIDSLKSKETTTELDKKNLDLLENSLNESVLNFQKELISYNSNEHDSILMETTDGSSVDSLELKDMINAIYGENSSDKEEAFESEKSGKYVKRFTTSNNSIRKDFTFTKLTHSSGIKVPFMEKTSSDNFTGERIFLDKNNPNIYQAMIGKLFGYSYGSNGKYTYDPKNALIDRITYQSASKADHLFNEDGSEKVFDLEAEIASKNIKTLEDVNNWKPDDKFLDNHVIEVPLIENGTQQDTPEHNEAQGNIGTQIELLINNVIKGDSSYTINNISFTGFELTNFLNELKIAYTKSGSKNVEDKLLSTSKLYELVLSVYDDREYLDRSTISEEKLSFLLKTPQFGMALVSKIQAQLKNELLIPKINSFQLFNGVVGTDKFLNILIEDYTDSEGVTRKRQIFEVAVPCLSQEMWDIAYNEKTGELDVDKLPLELREMVVYRVPSEATYSTFVIRIKKLLHPSGGARIYMPIGTTVIAGFDMDIDKIFGMMKNYKFNKKTKTVEITEYSLIENDDINYKEWFKEHRSFSDFQEISDLQKELKKLFEEKSFPTKKIGELYQEKTLLKREIIDDLKVNTFGGRNISDDELDEILNSDERYNNITLTIDDLLSEKSGINDEIIEKLEKIKEIRAKYRAYWEILTIPEQMSKYQLQNFYVDVFKSIISSSSAISEFATGNSDERPKQIAEEQPPTVINSDIPELTINESSNMFINIMSGADNIANSAVMGQFIGLVNFMRNLGNSDFITIDGTNLIIQGMDRHPETGNYSLISGLHNFGNKTNEKINLANAQNLAQAVDNVKSLISLIINQSKEIIPLKAVLYMIGLDPEIVDRLFVFNAGVNNFLKEAIISGDISNATKNNIFLNYPMSKKRGKKLVNFDPDTGDKTIYLSDLDEVFSGSIQNDLKSLKLNADDIIRFLAEFQSITTNLVTIINTINLHNKGFGSNLNDLLYNYIKVNKLLKNPVVSKVHLNLEGSYVETKLKNLIKYSNTVYSRLGVELDSPEFLELIDSLGQQHKPLENRYYGSTFTLMQSFKIYGNLINYFKSYDALRKVYFEQVNSVLSVFNNNTIVKRVSGGLVKSENSNLNLMILGQILREVEAKHFFTDSVEEVDLNLDLYPKDIQFLGQSEDFGASMSPKSIVDMMTYDHNTLYYAGDDVINFLDKKYISSRDLIKKLFFISIVQSATVPGKNNRGRSNMFEMLFLDNLSIHNNLLFPDLGTYSNLFKTPIYNTDFKENNEEESLSLLTNFVVLNIEDLFFKYTINLNDMSDSVKEVIKSIIVGDLTQDFFDSDSYEEDVLEELSKLNNKKYISAYNKGTLFLYEILGNNIFNLKRLGIIGMPTGRYFSSRFHPIGFKSLNNLFEGAKNTGKTFEIKSLGNKSSLINDNFRLYGFSSPISIYIGTEINIDLRNTSNGLILESAFTKTQKDKFKADFDHFKKDEEDNITKEKNTHSLIPSEGERVILLSCDSRIKSKKLSDETENVLRTLIGTDVKFVFENTKENAKFLNFLTLNGHNNFEVFGMNGASRILASDVEISVSHNKERSEKRELRRLALKGRLSIVSSSTKKQKHWKKDEAMANNSTKGIAIDISELHADKMRPNYVSSTKAYLEEIGNNHDFKPDDRIWIFGAGEWNFSESINKNTVKTVFDEFFGENYKPLIDKAIEKGVKTFSIGHASGIDKLASNYLTELGFIETVKDEWSEWNHPSTKSVAKGDGPKGEQVQDGVFINQDGLTKEEQLELFEFLKPILESQGVRSNISDIAPIMAGLELNWDYVSNRRGKQTRIDIDDKLIRNDTYGWFELSANGKPLGIMSERFRELLSKSSGIDISDYDGAIINVYDVFSLIQNHPDIDEHKSAENYPVVVQSIGGNGNIVINKSKYTFSAGGSYIFGYQGMNRKAPHSTYAADIDGFLPELHIKNEMTDKVYKAGEYRITATVRRVRKLDKDMPNEPNLYTPKQKVNETKSIAETIYSKLTKSNNLIIEDLKDENDKWRDMNAVAKKHGGINALRTFDKDHFGNDFSSVKRLLDSNPKLIRTGSNKESVIKYIDWVINSTDDRAKWIRSQIKSGELKGKKIIYTNTDANKSKEPSHADALDYLINNPESPFAKESNQVYTENVEQKIIPKQVDLFSDLETNKPTKPVVRIAVDFYQKRTPKENPNTAFIFTENLQARIANNDGTQPESIPNPKEIKLDVTSTNNQSGIRRFNNEKNPNVFGVITKKYQQNVDNKFVVAGEGNFTAGDIVDLNLFVNANRDVFKEILNSGFKEVVFPKTFGDTKAILPTKFAIYLQKELFRNFGLVTELNEEKTGLISLAVDTESRSLDEALSKFGKKIDNITNEAIYLQNLASINKNQPVMIDFKGGSNYKPFSAFITGKIGVKFRGIIKKDNGGNIISKTDDTYAIEVETTSKKFLVLEKEIVGGLKTIANPKPITKEDIDKLPGCDS